MLLLEELHLEKNSAVPLYEQLRQNLSEAIVHGKLPGGAKMPTEEELCSALGISRPVARQAYAELIESGLVERTRGRGTFVKLNDARGRFLNKQLSFMEEMRIMGLTPRTVLLRSEFVPYEKELFARLNLSPEDRCYHVARMRYANDVPFVLVENYLPEPLFPGIDQYDFEKSSLYEVLDRKYHLHVVRARRKISAEVASTEVAALLDRYRGAPILCVENTDYDQYNRPIGWSREYLDGYEHRFEFDVYNQ